LLISLTASHVHSERRSPHYGRLLQSHYLVREPDGVRAIDERIESWDELSRLLTEQPESVARVRPAPFEVREGIWAKTTEVRQDRLIWERFGEPWPPEIELAGYRVYADALLPSAQG